MYTHTYMYLYMYLFVCIWLYMYMYIYANILDMCSNLNQFDPGRYHNDRPGVLARIVLNSHPF